MRPLYNNILACLASLVYIKVIVGACDYGVQHKRLSPAVSRKLVHMAAGAWCLCWPYFDTSHASWRLNVAIPAVYSVQLFVKGLSNNPNDPDVRAMSRSGRPIELLQGPWMFTLVMLYAGLYEFMTACGVYIMAAVGIGDGLAPLVARWYPFGVYRTYGNEYKTLSGSIGMFVGTILGVLFLRAGIGQPEQLDWGEIISVAFMATVVEAVSGKWDNPLIAASVAYYLRATTKIS